MESFVRSAYFNAKPTGIRRRTAKTVAIIATTKRNYFIIKPFNPLSSSFLTKSSSINCFPSRTADFAPSAERFEAIRPSLF